MPPCCHAAALQIATGKVRNVTAPNAADLMKEGWTLLDVRPPQEIEKVGVKGAVEVRAVPRLPRNPAECCT